MALDLERTTSVYGNCVTDSKIQYRVCKFSENGELGTFSVDNLGPVPPKESDPCLWILRCRGSC